MQCSDEFPLYSKMLVKLTPGVNFTNILWGAALSYKSVLHRFSVLTVCVCIIFLVKENGKKAASNMLVKLIPDWLFEDAAIVCCPIYPSLSALALGWGWWCKSLMRFALLGFWMMQTFWPCQSFCNVMKKKHIFGNFLKVI